MSDIDNVFSEECLYTNSIESMMCSLSTESMNEKNDKIFIILFKKIKHNIINTMINIRTGFDYTHTGISLTENLSQYYDMMPDGIRNINGKKINEDRECDVYSIDITTNQKNTISSLLKEFQQRNNNGSLKYDFKSLFSVLFGFTHKNYDSIKLTKDEIINKSSYICSAFVAGIVAAVSPSIKNYIMSKKLNISTINPGDLTNFPGINKEYTINLKTKKKEKNYV